MGKFWEEGKGNAKERVVLYNCTSGYPVPFKDVCLLDLRLIQSKYANRVKAIGFSGHHLGIAVDMCAYAMGAEWNERHFTKDRTWKGTDHAASLEPAGPSNDHSARSSSGACITQTKLRKRQTPNEMTNFV